MVSLLSAATDGLGVYSIAEAARYAKMPAATIRSWFFPAHSRPLRRGDIDAADEKALTFLDFVEALAVRSLRVDYGVSLATIRKAITFAQEAYKLDHIFAREDHRTLIDAHRQLHINFPGEDGPVKMGGKGAGQMTLSACVEGYMSDLKFDQNKVARIYTAFRYQDQNVVMNPGFRFGEPIMEENGYPADILWRGVISEGSFERAAELYDASLASVHVAYRYCNGELGMAA